MRDLYNSAIAQLCRNGDTGFCSKHADMTLARCDNYSTEHPRIIRVTDDNTRLKAQRSSESCFAAKVQNRDVASASAITAEFGRKVFVVECIVT